MIIFFSLNENDFLQTRLFIASKSDRIKKQRYKSWIIWTIAFFSLGFMFYQSGNKLLTYYFLSIGFLYLAFYPTYQKWRYKNFQQKLIKETYQNKIDQIINIKFTNAYIETNDITGESKINLTEIENITETKDFFYLKLKTNNLYLMLPKLKIENIDDLRKKLLILANDLKIIFLSELNWKWS